MKPVTGMVCSVDELHRKPAEGCIYMCGMCPPCVFAPTPPGSSRHLWKASDEFRRRFVVALLSCCGSIQLLEHVQGVLSSATSWTVHTYGRSRRPASPQDYPPRCSHSPPAGPPVGVDLKGIWKWFNGSPDWVKLSYVCSIFSLCDLELLHMVANLTSVLLVRQKRGFLQFNVSNYNNTQHDAEELEDPALMVVPGSFKSFSGVSRHRDFISCLPVDLSKRILGLLDAHTLRCCMTICGYWQHLAQETLYEIKFKRTFQDQMKSVMKGCRIINTVSPTYANIVEVPVPIKDEEEDIDSSDQKVHPFTVAYANIKTRTVHMEERNVYCDIYFTKVLLDNEDPYRVVDYRGGLLMATGSKDRLVHLFTVGSKTEAVSVLKGHLGSIRAVLLCEDRDLLITASCDSNIRCWNLKTDRCDMVLYGHSGTISCLDVHADRLVSGAKDCKVKVWCLQTGKHFDDFNFKHANSVLCVKISKTTVYSSCNRGLIKIWDMERASLLRVIDAHRSRVKCLFLDEWHLLSGDSSGKVMAWSVSNDVKKCLMTFSHQTEVKSLTLVYLRVITGCVDGKICIFNFLTGDCLREITAEKGTGRILSVHFLDQSILLNTIYGVKLYQFAKVFWDYANSPRDDSPQDDVMVQERLVSGKSAAFLRKFPVTSTGAERLPSATQKSHSSKKPKRAELLRQTGLLFSPTQCQTEGRVSSETAKQSVMLSEKAVSERIKKRGLHHPLTRDYIHLRVNAIQRAQTMEEVSINMESNARLRDSWGPHTASLHSPPKQSLQSHDGPPNRAKTCVPTEKQAVTQNMTNRLLDKEASTASEIKRRAL